MSTEKTLAMARELVEARAKATPGEWKKVTLGDGLYDAIRTFVHDDKTGFGDDIICDMDGEKPEAKGNSEFICLSANHSSTIAQALIIAMESLEMIGEPCFLYEPTTTAIEVQRELINRTVKARQTLQNISQLVGDK